MTAAFPAKPNFLKTNKTLLKSSHLCQKEKSLSKSSGLGQKVFRSLSKSSLIFVKKTRSDIDKMSTGRGGARHMPKPHIDVMLVYDALNKHRDILVNFGPYNALSKSMAVDPKGLMHCYFLLDELIKISPTGEIHSQPMRQALLKVLQEHPEVNDTKYNGQVWMNIKSERLNVILSHCRRLKVQSSWGSCAAKLTGAEYQLLQKLIQGMSGKVVLDEPPKKRVLKKEESDISIDENGFPNILKTPEPKEATVLALEDAKPEAVSKGVKRPLTKRLGQRAKANIEKQRGQKGKSMAAKKKTKKKRKSCERAFAKKASAQIPKGPGDRRAWPWLEVHDGHPEKEG